MCSGQYSNRSPQTLRERIKEAVAITVIATAAASLAIGNARKDGGWEPFDFVLLTVGAIVVFAFVMVRSRPRSRSGS